MYRRRVAKKSREEVRRDNIKSLSILCSLAAMLLVLVVCSMAEESKVNDFENVKDENDREIVYTVEYQPIEEVEEIKEEPEYIEFKATAYCACEKCCGKWALTRGDGPVIGAAGKELITNYSVAIDHDLYEFGTVFEDENGNRYEAADTGSAVKGNHIDIYMSSHEEALNWGVKTVKLTVIDDEHS